MIESFEVSGLLALSFEPLRKSRFRAFLGAIPDYLAKNIDSRYSSQLNRFGKHEMRIHFYDDGKSKSSLPSEGSSVPLTISMLDRDGVVTERCIYTNSVLREICLSDVNYADQDPATFSMLVDYDTLIVEGSGESKIFGMHQQHEQ